MRHRGAAVPAGAGTRPEGGDAGHTGGAAKKVAAHQEGPGQVQRPRHGVAGLLSVLLPLGLGGGVGLSSSTRHCGEGKVTKSTARAS